MDLALGIAIVLFWIACVVGSAVLASRKRRSPVWFAVVGFFMGAFGLGITALVDKGGEMPTYDDKRVMRQVGIGLLVLTWIALIVFVPR